MAEQSMRSAEFKAHSSPSKEISGISMKVNHTSNHALKGSVLVVEDDELTGRWLLKEMLQKGLDCHWVQTQAAALELISTRQFHAVVTDIYLQEEKSGLELIRSLNNSGLPIVVITSRADLNIAKEALNHGASYLLEKPFETSELFSMLEKAWEEPRGLTGAMERFFQLQSLTPKEKEIARLLLKGLSNREISQVTGNTEKTIKFHLTVIFQKCGVKSRTELFNVIFPT